MTWCDKLASTPGIGVMLDKLYTPLEGLLGPLTPIISQWVDRDKQAFTVDAAPDPFNCTLTTFDGYQYSVGPEIFAVEFRHRIRFRPQSAGPPSAELLSKPAPYTELLEQITTRFIDLLRLVTEGKVRKLRRIGIISTTAVNENEVPPGILRFIKYVAKPWETSADAYNIELTTKLPKLRTTVVYDRCLHSFTKSEDNEGLVNIRLDWQRYLDDRNFSLASLPGLLETAKRDALAYFEELAEGVRFDE